MRIDHACLHAPRTLPERADAATALDADSEALLERHA
ncbi:hypothetical protein XTALMG727_3772 [Xanthomonas translucens pv. arrhenatheri LMG 727]|uniref:Uncharacterized protein n=1 Tax=Xanthomonas graminis pv. arrhenatheri LMG 727 TaxID=1195923 RepID=A0A0K3A5A9_9XANT|nr:hypothetical protein XTALMG727_3772 [Xanthomonas translucens pv. arrhenatheri LMG 727]